MRFEIVWHPLAEHQLRQAQAQAQMKGAAPQGGPLISQRFDRRPGSLLGGLLRFGGLQTVVALAGVVSYQLDALIIGLAPLFYILAFSITNLNQRVTALEKRKQP